MIAELLVIGIGLVLGFFGYSWFTGRNPGKIMGIVTSLTTSGTAYATSVWTGFIVVLKAAIAGGWGLAGYAFVLIWFVAIPLLWFVQGLRGWYHDRPFLASMIQ